MMIVIICLAVVLLEIIFLMISNKKNREQINYMKAAANIARDMELDYLLRNPYALDAAGSVMPDIHNFICLSQKNAQTKQEYVFGLNNVINIGRARNNNQLIVNDNMVSEYHCAIYRDQGTVFIRDLNSANGLILKTGKMKKYLISDGNSAVLSDGNTIVIGTMEFLVRFIYLENH